MSTCCRSIFFSSSARAFSLMTPPLDCSFCWSAWSALFLSFSSVTFFWLSACTLLVATFPSADSLAIRWMLMKANFVPSGNRAGGDGAGAGAAGGAGAAVGAGGAAGFGAGWAGAWANAGAAISIAPSTAAPVKALIAVVVLSLENATATGYGLQAAGKHSRLFLKPEVWSPKPSLSLFPSSSRLEGRSHREAEHEFLGRPQAVVQDPFALRVFRKDQPERHVEHRHEETDLGAR